MVGVYVSLPSLFSSKELWKQIARLPGNATSPWPLMGDLNEISDLDEKQSHCKARQLNMSNLKILFQMTI